MEERSNQTSEGGALDKLRRHVRILVDIGRLSGENADLDRFLDQTVVQIARAVEIHHVKVLRYRPDTSDLLLVAGVGWKVPSAPLRSRSTYVHRLGGHFKRESRSASNISAIKKNMCAPIS
jgi:hypothetical protein